LRSRSSAARSGRSSLGTVGSRSGNPTEPNRIASDALADVQRHVGQGLPGKINAGPADRCVGDNELEAEPFFRDSRSTLIASRMTSGPMPSPARAAMLKCFINQERLILIFFAAMTMEFSWEPEQSDATSLKFGSIRSHFSQ
jgi:hypothetical protein